MKPLLVVMTLLSGEGPTGVETHFTQIIGAAKEQSIETMLVTPYTLSRWARAPFRPLKKIRNERARVAYRWTQALLLQWQARAILRHHPDRAITFSAQCPLSAQAALQARSHRTARVVATVHYNGSEADEVIARGLAPSGALASHFDRIERRALPRTDGIAFVSNFMREIVNARVPSARRVDQETLFNFPARALPAEMKGVPTRDLLTAGTLEPRKNQQYLLHVLSEAKRMRHRYTLTIAGSGPDRGLLENLARSLGVSEQVSFLGHHPNAAGLIVRHRVVVHAAVAENCPMIVAEALLRGRPIAAAPVGGIPELFKDGVEGLYWDLQNPAQGAEQLCALLEHAPRYQQAVEASRARGLALFSDARQRWLAFLLPSLSAPIKATAAEANSLIFAPARA